MSEMYGSNSWGRYLVLNSIKGANCHVKWISNYHILQPWVAGGGGDIRVEAG
jgi:hypothetical protein